MKLSDEDKAALKYLASLDEEVYFPITPGLSKKSRFSAKKQARWFRWSFSKEKRWAMRAEREWLTTPVKYSDNSRRWLDTKGWLRSQ